MNYARLDKELEKFLDVLLTPTEKGDLYVPMPTTVWLLRRLNAVCARNMVATDFQVGEQENGVKRESIYEFKSRARKDRKRGRK